MTVRILVGDVGERLADLPDNSVHMVCTSPPYFGLRSYGTPPQVWGGDADCAHDWAITPVKGELRGGNWAQGTNGRGEVQPGGYQAKQVKVYESIDTGWCQRCGAWLGHLGLEPTLALFLDHLVDVFRDVRRVLRPDGTCWLNIGDSFASGSSGGFRPGSGRADGVVDLRGQRNRNGTSSPEFKPKDLMMVPARLAIALCDDGWYLRSDIIWHKRAPMPESVTDRPTSAHEHIFLLTKQPKYFYDSVAVAEDSTGVNGGGFSKSYAEAQPAHGAMALARPADNGTRNLRNVWTLSPEPFTGWTQTSRQVRVEPDDADDDTTRITSPDCPLHADQPDSVPTARDGGRGVSGQSRNPGSDDRPVQSPVFGSGPIALPRARGSAVESSGSIPLLRFDSAMPHSNGTSRMDHDPATSPPCTPFVQTIDRIDDTSALPVSSDSVDHTPENSIEQGDSVDHPSVQTLSRSVDMSSCTCSYHKTVTESISHFATFPTEIPRRCIKAGTSERGCCGAMVKKLKLRSDLTDEQRAMVYARLGSKGLV